MSNVVPIQTQISPYGFGMEGDLQVINGLLKKHALYDIPDHMRAAIISDAGATFDNPEASITHKNAAAKVLLECEKRNIDMLKMVVPKQVVHRTVKEMTTEEIEEALDEYYKVRNEVVPERQLERPLEMLPRRVSPTNRRY